ncbi:MAG: methionyl-tRNA formyltransferase [Legionellaceae bacterium]|nr:methionyl-tRNA formyltransferase [Legionellaceae bacterium]
MALRIVFAGTPDFATPCLDALIQSHHQVLAVYTKPDQPVGRGRTLQGSPVKALALAHQLPVYQPSNFKAESDRAALAALNAEIMVVIAYGLILPVSVLNIPRFGCINVHASALPQWRGASPIQSAIWHGDTLTGISIIQMDKGMDTGDILHLSTCPIDARETSDSLHLKLAEAAIQPLLDTLSQIEKGSVIRSPQDNTQASYTRKIEKKDARIDWNQSAEAIDWQIRACNPWPIAFTETAGLTIRIHEAIPDTRCHSGPPGTLLALEETGLRINTGSGSIQVQRLQLPGGKILDARTWVRTQRKELPIGTHFL